MSEPMVHKNSTVRSIEGYEVDFSLDDAGGGSAGAGTVGSVPGRHQHVDRSTGFIATRDRDEKTL